MRYQRTDYTCAPAAVANALRCLGETVDERAIAALANTDRGGTTDMGILIAIRALGYDVVPFESKDFGAARAWLLSRLRDGVPVVLDVQQWRHYVTAIGAVGDRVIVFDPSGSVPSERREHGIFVLDAGHLDKLWRHRRWGTYAAIGVAPPRSADPRPVTGRKHRGHKKE